MASFTLWNTSGSASHPLESPQPLGLFLPPCTGSPQGFGLLPIPHHPVSFWSSPDLCTSHWGRRAYHAIPQRSWAVWPCHRCSCHFSAATMPSNTVPCDRTEMAAASGDAAVWPSNRMIHYAFLTWSAQCCRKPRHVLQHCIDHVRKTEQTASLLGCVAQSQKWWPFYEQPLESRKRPFYEWQFNMASWKMCPNNKMSCCVSLTQALELFNS